MKYVKRLNELANVEYIKKNYSLDNIKLILSYLGEPQKKVKNIIHITGTNGKGSVVYYVSNILKEFGYTVGTFTSPHIFDVTERICINNRPILYKDLEKYLEKVFNVTDKLKVNLTFFEILTCVMFLYFSDFQPDFTVLEVGLGGKLDATNVIDRSIISVITSISLDHTEVLGNTIKKIAIDKSGIIKPRSICICGDENPVVKKIVLGKCREVKTKCIFVGKGCIKDININFHNWETLFKYKGHQFVLPLCSKAQPVNAVISIKVVEELYRNKILNNFSWRDVYNGIKITIPARMEKINWADTKQWIIDAAHNPQAVKNFVDTIKLLKQNFVLAFTIMKEKDFITILKILSTIKNKIKKLCVYKIDGIERCQDIELVYSEARKLFSNVEKFYSVKSLLNYIKNFDTVVFTGSFYPVAKLVNRR